MKSGLVHQMTLGHTLLIEVRNTLNLCSTFSDMESWFWMRVSGHWVSMCVCVHVCGQTLQLVHSSFVWTLHPSMTLFYTFIHVVENCCWIFSESAKYWINCNQGKPLISLRQFGKWLQTMKYVQGWVRRHVFEVVGVVVENIVTLPSKYNYVQEHNLPLSCISAVAKFLHTLLLMLPVLHLKPL